MGSLPWSNSGMTCGILYTFISIRLRTVDTVILEVIVFWVHFKIMDVPLSEIWRPLSNAYNALQKLQVHPVSPMMACEELYLVCSLKSFCPSLFKIGLSFLQQ